MEKYDVFISYRRDGGFETAKHLFDLLTRDGYKVSFDIDTLRSGDFDEQLYERIEFCKDFILIVDQHTFDRTIIGKIPREKDWLRCELAYALQKNKNVIPIFLTGVSNFPNNLPNDIVGVVKKNGPEYNRYYFDDFYRVLKRRFLHNNKSIKRWIIAILLGFLICFVGTAIIYVPTNNGNDFYFGNNRSYSEPEGERIQYSQQQKEANIITSDSLKVSNEKKLENSTQSNSSTNEIAEKAEADKNVLMSDKNTLSTPRSNSNSNITLIEKSIQHKNGTTKKSTEAPKENVKKEVKTQSSPTTPKNGNLRVYDIDELMKLAALGDPRAYVPLAKYYYRNASGMSSYERVHIYSMKAINANVDVAEAKKLINNIDALGFYHGNNKYKKPKL